MLELLLLNIVLSLLDLLDLDTGVTLLDFLKKSIGFLMIWFGFELNEVRNNESNTSLLYLQIFYREPSSQEHQVAWGLVQRGAQKWILLTAVQPPSAIDACSIIHFLSIWPPSKLLIFKIIDLIYSKTMSSPRKAESSVHFFAQTN